MSRRRLPPWREITPDEFVYATYKATAEAQKAFLEARDRGEFRLRVVLREAQDLKYGSHRDPLWLHDYKFGVRHILKADELVIETRDGQRHLVKRPGVKPASLPETRA